MTKELAGLWREFDKLFDVFNEALVGSRYPKRDYLVKDEGGYIYALEVPGRTKEQVKVEVVDNKLTITVLTGNYRKREFPLSRVDQTRISAKVENGLLTVKLPLKTDTDSRVITVE
jgi:HSP20 family molecular chaperone IbpA